MQVRRVVIGENSQGKSVFVESGAAPLAHEFKHLPGQGLARIWMTNPGQKIGQNAGLPDGEPMTATGPMLPAAGGTSFVIAKYAPDSVFLAPNFNGPAAGGEFYIYAPDLAATMEPDAPGMHRTDSIDYGVVLDGEIWLEVDDGREVQLKAGDTIVQLGGRHAWRNKSDRTTTVAFVLCGASRT
ncbi:cupin domain-containing protein (plasmid) [Agrobacterium tumefaciens]|uniref:Cupin domain-containing protein n=1 Tax=Agrobacterium tumefaciens TaxID=358 RepID=A0AAP9EAL0_AGRTU|nr:cupin domain-containing protein [Agrobacterium tumefaciens]NSZ60062.1 cupin domain-containing protein [Agrobacterium tumefaciens]QDY97662.1 cupin domain-containing protein [Agrobacterium tumefaciens]UXS12785.1 cupin domain-containing protein [Agrobacterium tumefaciens]UXS20146.1 cupin domain-containing protein [Agrobacterium tumefaciens]UXS27794.1 cupin domain-containing protein [Agrobacterium tumefaciens]